MSRSNLREKFTEALGAVLPIVIIVLILSLTIAPIPTGVMLAFLFGSLLLIVGMMLFSLGADLAMQPMGECLGATLPKTKKLWLILSVGFLLGFMITMSEPDLQVLANQVPSIPNTVLIVSVAAGVGMFLVFALLRMLVGFPIQYLLLASYAAVFALVIFAPADFLAVAFDSGGVTTGPMTVPFIMSFGIGIAAIRSDRHAADDSFGLVALCSVGPILAVLILSLIFSPDSSAVADSFIPDASETRELGGYFLDGFPVYIKEMALSLLPIAVFFAIFELIAHNLSKSAVSRILIGILYTYAGLVLFLTGANVGFMPAGSYLGGAIASLDENFIIVPIGMVIGFFIVKAEPAVYVLMRQVEELTDGAIAGRSLLVSLSVGVAISIGLALLRVIYGIPILYFVGPGYFIALTMSFFVPKMFTAIAFDSGGVASGPMTAAFLLPFAMGACRAVGGDIVSDAFGVVAMVAMTPLITIQVLGVIYRIKSTRGDVGDEVCDVLSEYGNFDIIEL